MLIRKAEFKDIGQLLDIYNYEVLNGCATLDLTPKTIDEWTIWFNSHNTGCYPLYVAEDGQKIAGYASLSSYREKEAYMSTAELSVYVAPEYRNLGVATRLLQTIINYAEQDSKIHLIVSVITSGNTASQRLHEKFNFAFCGTIHEAGFKFGEYLSIDNYELIL